MYLHTQDLNVLLPQTPPWFCKLTVGYTQVWGLVQAVLMCHTQDARLKESDLGLCPLWLKQGVQIKACKHRPPLLTCDRCLVHSIAVAHAHSQAWQAVCVRGTIPQSTRAAVSPQTDSVTGRFEGIKMCDHE